MAEDLVRVGQVEVCADCKVLELQRLRERGANGRVHAGPSGIGGPLVIFLILHFAILPVVSLLSVLGGSLLNLVIFACELAAGAVLLRGEWWGLRGVQILLAVKLAAQLSIGTQYAYAVLNFLAWVLYFQFSRRVRNSFSG